MSGFFFSKFITFYNSVNSDVYDEYCTKYWVKKKEETWVTHRQLHERGWDDSEQCIRQDGC